MKHLLTSWGELEPVVTTQTVMLFFNEEQTLEPPSKGKAKRSPAARKMLQALASTAGIKTAVVSSRPLAELKKRLAVRGLIYVASQGLELEEPTGRFIHPHAAGAKKLMAKIWDRLKKTLKPFSAVAVQDKHFTLSVRYRRVAKENLDRVRAVFFRTVRSYLSSSQVVVKEGEGSWEISPAPKWNKGTTIVWLYGKTLAQSHDSLLPIYLGDGLGDEDVFYSIKPLGLGVKTTPESGETSAATYFLQSPREIPVLVKRILACKASAAKKIEGQSKTAELASSPVSSL